MELWCELVLNGIGGRTIAEAMERLSFSEFMIWVRYRAKRGSLNVGQRVEAGSALLASIYANHKAGKSKFSPHDFMPHFNRPPAADEKEIDLETAIGEWL